LGGSAQLASWAHNGESVQPPCRTILRNDLARHAISDANWDRIKDLLPGRPGLHGKVAKDNRLFVDAVLWIAKTGAPWRDLPERFGNWNSAWRRFDRWARKGVWKRVFEALQDPDLEWLILDATVVRAHQHAAGQKGG
jgi:transposase